MTKKTHLLTLIYTFVWLFCAEACADAQKSQLSPAGPGAPRGIQENHKEDLHLEIKEEPGTEFSIKESKKKPSKETTNP